MCVEGGGEDILRVLTILDHTFLFSYFPSLATKIFRKFNLNFVLIFGG